MSKPGVDGTQREQAADHEAGADHEGQREGDLADNEDIPPELFAGACGCTSRVLLDDTRKPSLRGAKCDRNPDPQADQHEDQDREAECLAVHSKFGRSADGCPHAGRENSGAPVGDGDSNRAPRQRSGASIRPTVA